MANIACGEDLTKFNEGLTLVAKPDTHGKFELGYGCDDWNGVPIFEGQTCTAEEAEDQFDIKYPLAKARAQTDIGAASYAVLSPQRQAILNDMAYEIGGAGLAAFKVMLTAIRAADWSGAVAALTHSKLFTQVPTREERNIQIMLTGEWP